MTFNHLSLSRRIPSEQGIRPLTALSHIYTIYFVTPNSKSWPHKCLQFSDPWSFFLFTSHFISSSYSLHSLGPMVHYFCHFPASILTILALLNFHYAPLAKTQSQSSQREKTHSFRNSEYHKGEKKKKITYLFMLTPT